MNMPTHKIILLLILCGIVGALLITRFITRSKIETKSREPIAERLQKQPINHLGIIMDGNRRWAQKQGLKPWLGHKEGVNPIKETISFCLEHKIKDLTLYTLSLENLKRPQEELTYLFDVLAKELASKELDDLFKNGIRVRFIGDRALFPSQLVPIINDIEKKTELNNKLNLNLLFCYGGQQELAAAAQKCCQTYHSSNPLSTAEFKSCLWSAELPPLDLVIRTAGDQRLSNFLPVQSAYSELYFISIFWPDLTKEHLIDAALFFLKSKRNFGA
jgi:undecaprenyl diphosphate synthase